MNNEKYFLDSDKIIGFSIDANQDKPIINSVGDGSGKRNKGNDDERRYRKAVCSRGSGRTA
jgi:hypothetical protein